MKEIYIDYEIKDFNYLSDIHADFHISEEQAIDSLVEQWMEGVNKSEVLIVAGDISNNKLTFVEVFSFLAQNWKYVFWVAGNHELYREKYQANIRPNKLDELIEAVEPIDNLYLLDRNSVYIFANLVKMAGCNLWYNTDDPDVFNDILINIKDSEFIGMGYIEDEGAKDLAFYNKVIDDVDIFVSHVPVINEFRYNNPSRFKSYYKKVKLRPGKTYVYGHNHKCKGMTILEIESVFLSRPVGYAPDKNYRIGYHKLWSCAKLQAWPLSGIALVRKKSRLFLLFFWLGIEYINICRF